MNRFSASEARDLRIRHGARLIDLAVAAGCAPATVRSFELGAVVRPAIYERLLAAYCRLQTLEPATRESAPPPTG